MQTSLLGCTRAQLLSLCSSEVSKVVRRTRACERTSGTTRAATSCTPASIETNSSSSRHHNRGHHPHDGARDAAGARAREESVKCAAQSPPLLQRPPRREQLYRSSLDRDGGGWYQRRGFRAGTPDRDPLTTKPEDGDEGQVPPTLLLSTTFDLAGAPTNNPGAIRSTEREKARSCARWVGAREASTGFARRPYRCAAKRYPVHIGST